MKRYAIHAYDANHNELWITIGTSFVGAEAFRRTDRIVDVANTYELVKTGKIIDPETGLPIIRQSDPNTGQRTQGSRYVAYFRTYANSTVSEIYITRHGRKVGVRNYQTRRDSDTRTTKIIGYRPIHTAPRIVNTENGYQLVVGEGNPNDLDCGNVDQWGDHAIHIATCDRITKDDTNDRWWGYTYTNHYTWEYKPLKRATVLDVRRHLNAIAKEMITKYGTDLTRW